MSISIQKNVSLRHFNTFGLEAVAKYFIEITSQDDLKEALSQNFSPILVLGGGSNMLFTRDWKGLVLKNETKGIEIVEKNDTHSIVAVGGGQNWHQFVLWSLNQNLGGIENLSLIPGTVGAAPIQNIGAYGVELKDVFIKLEAWNLTTGEEKVFLKEECQFGYRDSIFKKALKGQFFISKVYLQLTNANHEIKIEYGAIKEILRQKNITQASIQDISDAIIAIRSSKLPDPEKLGNSGSFFKNPEIDNTQFLTLLEKFPNLVFYELENDVFKIPAGWLIEQCGWKGLRIGNTGAHKDQALVLVNYGQATGNEVWLLAKKIQQSVRKKFGIDIHPEVNII